MDIENTIKIMLKGAADHTDDEEIRAKLKKEIRKRSRS